MVSVAIDLIKKRYGLSGQDACVTTSFGHVSRRLEADGARRCLHDTFDDAREAMPMGIVHSGEPAAVQIGRGPPSMLTA